MGMGIIGVVYSKRRNVFLSKESSWLGIIVASGIDLPLCVIGISMRNVYRRRKGRGAPHLLTDLEWSGSLSPP